MKFVPSHILVQEAQKAGYAVPALNTNGSNYEITRAALEASQELSAPLVIQVYEGNVSFRGYDYFVHLVDFLCDELGIKVPVAIQLDHGKSLDSIVGAIKAGFTAVMFDASHDPIEKNIEKTNRMAELARAAGVSLEAEIGYVKGNEPPQEKMIGRYELLERPTIPIDKTRVDEAVRFAEAVDIDMLAVSIGSIHGVYQKQDQLDFELLRKIREAVSIPLVSHGTSGISVDDLKKLTREGMAKINFGEPFRYDYIRYFCRFSDEIEHLWHSWRVMEETKDALVKDMKVLIRALGADGKV